MIDEGFLPLVNFLLYGGKNMADLKLVTESEVAEQEAKDNVQKANAEEMLVNGYFKTRYAGKDCYVRHPSPKDVAQLQREYATGFAKYLREGEMLTKREMLQILDKRGIWTKQDALDLEEKRQMYMDQYKAWYSYPNEERANNEEFAKIQLDYLRAMSEFTMAASQLDGLLINTVEKILEAEQAIKKTYLCVYKEPDGKERFFKSQDEVENPTDTEKMSTFIGDCLAFWMGLGERFLEQLPEITSGKNDTKQ